MKFSAVRFSTSVVVFKGDYATGMLSIEPNETSKVVDSLEVQGQFLICKRDGQVKAVPISKIESADLVADVVAQPARKTG